MITLKSIVVGLMLGVTMSQCLDAHADDGAVLLNVGGWSYHFDKRPPNEQKYNESNPALGLQWNRNDEIAAMAGAFKNSTGRWSLYACGRYQPAAFLGGRFGARACAVDGYHQANGGNVIPMAALEQTWQVRGFLEASLLAWPNVEKHPDTGAKKGGVGIALMFSIHGYALQ